MLVRLMAVKCMCSFELGVDVMDYMDDLLGLQAAGKWYLKIMCTSSIDMVDHLINRFTVNNIV